MNEVMKYIAQVPNEVWYIIIVICAVGIIVSIIQKALKFAVAIGIACFLISGTGLTVDSIVQQSKDFAEEHKEDINKLKKQATDAVSKEASKQIQNELDKQINKVME